MRKIKVVVLVLVLLFALSAPTMFPKLPKTFARHPILTIRAMQSVPIGAKVLPFFDETLWCRDYRWGCGNPGTVVGYKVVTDFDDRPLLIYLVRIDSARPVTIEIHPAWVIKLAL